MAFFISPRNRMHVSKSGHAIEFKKGERTWVPPHLHAEVADFADPVEPLPEEPASPAVATAPVDPMLRHQDILAAIELVATRNQREDFTAAGAPHLGALSTILGWKPEARERDQLWARFQVDKDD